jgi:rhodanese-related sulfurtransferase
LSAQTDDKVVDDVDVETAWTALQSSPRSQLVDVRTRAEWTYVGIPDLGPVGKRTVLVEWQTFPDQGNGGDRVPFLSQCRLRL